MSKIINLYSKDKKYKCGVELSDSKDHFGHPEHSAIVLLEEKKNGTYVIAQAKDNILETEKDLLIEQQKKEIEKLKEQLSLMVNRIDLLTHDKDYRFLNYDGTWYSRESCQNLSFDAMFYEIDKELNDIEINLEKKRNAIIPKFKIGQEVWYINCFKIYSFKINKIKNRYCDNRNFLHYESELFVTKEEAEQKLKELKEENNVSDFVGLLNDEMEELKKLKEKKNELL